MFKILMDLVGQRVQINFDSITVVGKLKFETIERYGNRHFYLEAANDYTVFINPDRVNYVQVKVIDIEVIDAPF